MRQFLLGPVLVPCLSVYTRSSRLDLLFLQIHTHTDTDRQTECKGEAKKMIKNKSEKNLFHIQNMRDITRIK